MQPRNRSISALLLGIGAVALTQSASFAIRPAQPVVDPMPKGAPFASQKTDLTPKPATATIDANSYVHPTAKVLGDVRVGAQVWIGPRASIRADLGHNILIGAGSNLQDGVVIWGYPTQAEGQKLPKRSIQELFLQTDPKDESTSVKLEENVSLLSQSQVVGPALIEKNSFIGAGALIYQSRIGAGSVIEAGAQVLNVELPPNTFVAAGQVISNPEVAKRLPTKDAARSDQNNQMTELYARLTRGYLGALDAGISSQQKNQWNASRKEVLWMPSIPLFESPNFASPSTDETSTRNPRAITIGDVSIAQSSTVAAGVILRADHGAKIELTGAMIDDGAILVADLSAHIEAPLPASQPASAPTSEPAGDVAPTAPLPGPRPPIEELRPNDTVPSIPPPPKDPASAPTTEPTSTSLPASLPAPKTPGIFMADQSKVGAAAVIYGSSTINEGAVVKARALVIHSDIGRNSIISEGAVVSNVYIPEGRLVAPGRSISTQEDALSLPTVPGYILGQTPATLEAPSYASGAAMIDPSASIDLMMLGGSVLRVAAHSYISDHTFLSALGAGAIELGENTLIQSGATLRTDKTISLSKGAIVSSQAFISGNTTLAEDSVVGARAFVEDSTIGRGSVVEPGAIVRNANIPENTLVPAGTVWAEGATQPIPADSSWRVVQPELAFAAKSFAAVYAETPREAELRGANQPKKAASTFWTPEAILLALLIIALLGALGFGVRDLEK